MKSLLLLVVSLSTLVLISQAKVKVDVYYETLCPDSIRFLVNKLIVDYDKIANLMDLTLIPFGKAEIYESRENIDFYCQHGPKECQGNMVHACVLSQQNNNYTRVLPFINCMEITLMRTPNPNISQVVQNCANDTNLSFDDIDKCASGAQGKTLLVEAGKKTKALKPKLAFVPTIVLNEKYSEANQNTALNGDFVKLITDANQKVSKPKSNEQS